MRIQQRYAQTERGTREIIKHILFALTNRLTYKENLQAVEIDVADTGAANTEFTVRHALGKIPRMYHWNVDVAAIVYDSQRANWTKEEMYLKCTVANVALTLTIT